MEKWEVKYHGQYALYKLHEFRKEKMEEHQKCSFIQIHKRKRLKEQTLMYDKLIQKMGNNPTILTAAKVIPDEILAKMGYPDP